MDTLYGSVIIRTAQPDEVAGLMEQSSALLRSLYPAESNHLVSAEELSGTNAVLLGAFLGESSVGMIGLVDYREDGYAEVKRLFVSEVHRGAGIATALMAEVEALAIEWGLFLMRLETGVKQPESLSLYSRLGYVTREAFGRYLEDEHSVFMERTLTA